MKLQFEGLGWNDDRYRLDSITTEIRDLISYIENSPPGTQKLSPRGYLPSTVYREWECDSSARTVHAHDPFKFIPQLLSIAVHPLILALMSRYFGKKFYLQQAIASRYYPMSPADFGSFQWHHDAWGKKINVMILFSEVTEEDQYMTYVEGSHKYIYDAERCSNSRFTEEDVQRLFRGNTHRKCTGDAGTIYIFDSNGMHRGNRSLGRARDSLIISYNAGRYIWDFEASSTIRNSLSTSQIKFLDECSKVTWFE